MITHRPSWFVALFAGALSLMLLWAGCKSGPEIPPAEPMPDGGSFEGVWYSPQFEQMYLRQNGDAVSGIYTYKYGGTIEGKVEGDLLVFRWIDPGQPEKARRTLKGSGYFKMGRDENDNLTLVGSWGYNDDYFGGGPWEAQFIRELDASDPENIEEFREQNVR